MRDTIADEVADLDEEDHTFLSRYFAHTKWEPCHCAGEQGCFFYGDIIDAVLYIWRGW